MKNELVFKQLHYSENELTQIIDLIKQNLDPNFTEEFFIWKHLQNPFGKSFGWSAWDSDKLVGLRLFMKWEFDNSFNNRISRSIRPVDTVVDKNYRGLGLFKKLTLRGLDLVDEDFEFVFNTPNSNSLPGYLKMGWVNSPDSGFFKLGLVNPFYRTSQISNLEFNKFIKPTPSFVETNRTKEFLLWRYSNPKYEIKCIGNDVIVFSRIRMKGIKTIVIFELIGESNNFGLLISSVVKYSGSWMVYYYNSEELPSNLFIKSITRQKAVIVTKQLSISPSLKFSLGDLEGVL